MSLKDKMFMAVQESKMRIKKAAVSFVGFGMLIGSATAINITGAGAESETAGSLINWLIGNMWLFVTLIVAIVVIFYVVKLVSRSVKGRK